MPCRHGIARPSRRKLLQQLRLLLLHLRPLLLRMVTLTLTVTAAALAPPTALLPPAPALLPLALAAEQPEAEAAVVAAEVVQPQRLLPLRRLDRARRLRSLLQLRLSMRRCGQRH